MPERSKPETIAASYGIVSDDHFRAVTPPIYLSSTFAFSSYGRSGRLEYSRTSNPSRDLLGDALAKLEGGAGAVITSSGMAAVDLVLSTVRRGDLVLAPHDCYWGTYRLLSARRNRDQFDVAFIDQGDIAALASALARGPKLVLVETPSNPLMRVVDIREIALLAKTAGAKTAVDNTFLSPALQRPIAHGADFVIHSTTKYLNGHSDVVGGAVVAADASDVEALSAWANVSGVIGAPFDAYLTLRGLRTLFPAYRAAATERDERGAFPGTASRRGYRPLSGSRDAFKPRACRFPTRWLRRDAEFRTAGRSRSRAVLLSRPSSSSRSRSRWGASRV